MYDQNGMLLVLVQFRLMTNRLYIVIGVYVIKSYMLYCLILLECIIISYNKTAAEMSFSGVFILSRNI